MRLHPSLCLLLLPLLFSLAACRPPAAPQQDNVIARVGQEVITPEAFASAAKSRGATTPEGQEKLLDEMVNDLRALELARQRGYERDPEIQRQLHAAMIAKVRESAGLGGEPSAADLPSEAALQDYYNKHQSDFSIPSRIHLAWVCVNLPASLSPAARQAKIARVQEVHARVLAQQPPAARTLKDIAQQYSEDQATRHSGGDLGWQLERDLSEERFPGLIKAAAPLQSPGEISPLVETSRTAFFVMLVERQPETIRPFQATRGEIIRRLQSGRTSAQEQRFEALLMQVPAEVHAEKLPSLPISAGAPDHLSGPRLPASPSQRGD
ncbi:MAG: peptidylprolyl isomerase [Prosthecobacter sp.]